ncbi:MAG: PadR family transcriptional regulator [Clostridiales bacterium]|jgi:PadR family transcriptional regulator PadR|nr:PadR family transcriptional regulator [Clostridiales bacterium]
MTENFNNGKSGTADGMKDNFKKATTEMLVLFLLGEKPMYVYEMIQALDYRSQSAYSVATLYPAIYRLQKFGFIKEYAKCVSEDNRLRKYYEVTPEGTAYMNSLRDEYHKLVDAVEMIFNSEDTTECSSVNCKDATVPETVAAGEPQE